MELRSITPKELPFLIVRSGYRTGKGRLEKHKGLQQQGIWFNFEMTGSHTWFCFLQSFRHAFFFLFSRTSSPSLRPAPCLQILEVCQHPCRQWRLQLAYPDPRLPHLYLLQALHKSLLRYPSRWGFKKDNCQDIFNYVDVGICDRVIQAL